MPEAEALEHTEARERLMLDYLAAWNDRDAGRVASFFAEDATYDDRGTSAMATGRDEIRAHVAGVHAAFPDLRFELVRAAHGERFTAGEWRSRMTHLGELDGLRPTGRVVESAGVDVATLDREGRIVHLVSYYDGAAIMRSLGLLPSRGSRLERALVRAASLMPRRRAATMSRPRAAAYRESRRASPVAPK
jgi:steroid delta-isomerase-like uncharacterized protein